MTIKILIFCWLAILIVINSWSLNHAKKQVKPPSKEYKEYLGHEEIEICSIQFASNINSTVLYKDEFKSPLDVQM